jgi:predicted nucleic acid-binding protein
VSVVLDADVVIGALDAADAHHGAARRALEGWHEAGTSRLLSAVTLTEILVAQAGDERMLRRARGAVDALGIRVVAPGESTAVDAARHRARHPISVPDAFCLALAVHAGTALASFDRRLSRAARSEGVRAASL